MKMPIDDDSIGLAGRPFAGKRKRAELAKIMPVALGRFAEEQPLLEPIAPQCTRALALSMLLSKALRLKMDAVAVDASCACPPSSGSVRRASSAAAPWIGVRALAAKEAP